MLEKLLSASIFFFFCRKVPGTLNTLNAEIDAAPNTGTTNRNSCNSHRVFNKKKCVSFTIKLTAEISIWMQSRFDGFDFSATLTLIFTH